MGEALGYGMEHEHSAPKDDRNTQVFSDGQTSKQPIGRVLDDENCNIDTSGEPGVLCTLEVCVFLNAHDTGEAQCAFV